MKQERVIAILDFYRDIDKTVTMNERVIRNLEDQYYSTLGAVNSDGMPHGKGGVSNPVERVVLNIPQSVSDTIANMRRENERLTVIKGEILSELNALNYREKAVIYGFYIDGLQWERLSQRVNYSPRQCRNTAVFHNAREHADVMEFWIDGVRYKGPVIIDDGGAQDRKKPSTDHVDGLVLVDLVVYVPLSLLKTIPQKGLNMEIGDHIYQITKVHPEAGEIVLYLEMLTE